MMVSCAAMAATLAATSRAPSTDTGPGSRDQYSASVTRLSGISVDLANNGLMWHVLASFKRLVFS